MRYEMDICMQIFTFMIHDRVLGKISSIIVANICLSCRLEIFFVVIEKIEILN